MAERSFLACDLGAESGRLMLGTLDAQRVGLEEVHRFANTPVRRGASLHWDIAGLWLELQAGLQKAARRGLRCDGISTDSWGVDYVLLGEGNRWIEPAFHYRDPRTARGVERVQAKIDSETLFEESGIQFMPLNTIYQLAAEESGRLSAARQVVLVGDAFNSFLSGVAVAEVSLASTTALYNPRTRAWSERLLGALGWARGLFPRIVPSGTRLGPLLPEVAEAAGLPALEVIATCSHDTGAAVAAVPAEGTGWGYISSGTWSLMGVEESAPVLTPRCRELNFTNEIGYDNSVRLLKNISGLWLVQECRRDWAQAGRDLDYATLTRLASEAEPFRSIINPADPVFVPPGDMPGRIAAFCRRTGQAVPQEPGAYVRCALESLALLYRRTRGELEQVTGWPLQRMHIVGGGSQNDLLNQFAANALQIPVLAGPVEATALGNVLVQALAVGRLPSLAAARSLVRGSFPLRVFEPRDAGAWAEAADRFEHLARATNGRRDKS